MDNELILKLINESSSLDDLKNKVLNFSKKYPSLKYYFNVQGGRIQKGIFEEDEKNYLIELNTIKPEYYQYIIKEKDQELERKCRFLFINNKIYDKLTSFSINPNISKTETLIDIYKLNESKLNKFLNENYNEIDELYPFFKLNFEDFNKENWYKTYEKLEYSYPKKLFSCGINHYFIFNNFMINFMFFNKIKIFINIQKEMKNFTKEDILKDGIRSYMFHEDVINNKDEKFLKFMNNIFNEIEL